MGVTNGGRSPTVDTPTAAASAREASSGVNGGWDKELAFPSERTDFLPGWRSYRRSGAQEMIAAIAAAFNPDPLAGRPGELLDHGGREIACCPALSAIACARSASVLDVAGDEVVQLLHGDRAALAAGLAPSGLYRTV